MLAKIVHGPTAKEVRHALGITLRSVQRRAERETWPYHEETTRGGKVRHYIFAYLPPDVQEAVLRLYPEYAPGLPAVREAAPPPAPAAAPRSFGSLPASSRDAAFSHLYTVNQLRQAIAESPRGKTAAILALAAAKQMAPNTLRNWLAIAEQARAQAEERSEDPAGAQLVALAPAYGRTRGQVRAFSPEALEWALALYLNEARPNLTQVCRALQAEALYHGWQVGSYDALARYIERHVEPAVRCAAREGMKKCEARYIHKLTRNYDEIWSNFMWVTDHHILDVHVLDGHGRIVRPWVTAWMDMKSRSLVGWCLSFTPSSRTVALALRHGILPKRDAEHFPQHGLPLVAYLDNGKDMRSEYLQGRSAEKFDFPPDMARFAALGIDPFYIDMRYDPAERAWVKKRGGEVLQVKDFRIGGIFTRMGISPRYATAYHPWAKPIERMFREFVQNFSRLQPGWCGTSPEQKPEKLAGEIKSRRLLPLEELAARWKDEAVNRYNGRPHGALDGRTPTEAWLAGLQGPVAAPDPALLDFALLKQERVKVHNWGFNLHGKRFELAIDAGDLNAVALLTRLSGTWVDAHHDFELREVRLYQDGQYVCDGRPVRLASYIDQRQEANTDGLRMQANQRTVIRLRTQELRRVPMAQRADAYITALGSLALPQEAPALPAPTDTAEPKAPTPLIFLNEHDRYDHLLREKAQGRPIAADDAEFMAAVEASPDYNAKLYEIKFRHYAREATS